VPEFGFIRANSLALTTLTSIIHTTPNPTTPPLPPTPTVGTIPLVAATAFQQAGAPVFGLGGDRDPLACGCASKNYQELKRQGGAAGLVQWDARRLPLRDGCLDVAVVDLPFGKKHKVKGGNLRHLYGQAFRECARSMRCVRVCVRVA
jgi:23S rRNA G2445 N2-methylase RlmL